MFIVKGGSCMFAIETIALTKRFKGVKAVQELNVQVREGEVYALMGPNGAGKTTLIKVLMNLMSPTEGEARVLGMSSESLQGKRFENIGYVSENQKMPDWMTVQNFLDYCRPFYPVWDKVLEQSLAKRFDLPRKQWLETDYEPERSASRAREILGPVEVQATSLTLREIFLTSARMGRQATKERGPL